MTREPMTQEQLDAIQARVDGATGGPWGCYGDGAHEVFDAGEYSDGDRGEVVAAVIDKLSDAVFIAEAREDIPALLAEVQRLRHFESIVSWRYGDTTDGKTQVAMTHRAARALGERFMEHPHLKVGALGHNFYPDARAALNAALDTGEGS